MSSPSCEDLDAGQLGGEVRWRVAGITEITSAWEEM